MSLDKIKSPAVLASATAELGARGKRLVFTNGCFDILHAGHVRYLQAARKLGDALAIALNGDASVRALKGEGRPINAEADRAEVLAALECVDFVTIFPEVRVTNLVREVRPHIYAKGGDYTVESLDAGERAALEDAGAEIKILPLVPGRSTTSVIQKMKQATDKRG
jgi:rfaE bifunctional protein nucleotidyltransferase chain/domain